MEYLSYASAKGIKSILLATDNSEAVAPAEQYAIELAANYNCRLLVFNVFENLSNVETDIGYDELVNQYKHQKQNELKLRFEKLITNRSVMCDVISYEKHETIASTIAKFAFKNYIDLVIAGTHGASGFKNNSFGSNTLALIQETNNPLIIVPNNAIYKTFQKIAFAFKGMDYEIGLIQIVLGLLNISIQNLELIHVTSDDDVMDLSRYEKLIQECLKDNSIQISYINDHNIANGLNNFTIQNKIDLLILTGTPKSFFLKLFSPNIVSRLSYQVNIPLLYLPI